MIEVENLKFKYKNVFFDNISFKIENGEIYILIFREEIFRSAFFELMRGFRRDFQGKILIDGHVARRKNELDAVFINMIDEVYDFGTETTMEQFVDYICSIGHIDKLSVIEHLIRLNISEDHLKNRIKNEKPDMFKMVYLSLLLGTDSNNLVINNFINVEDKVYEVGFNKTLNRKREEGKAILYLTGDIFYAFQVADKVGFVKNGYLAPENPIVCRDYKEMDIMTLYNRYMS